MLTNWSLTERSWEKPGDKQKLHETSTQQSSSNEIRKLSSQSSRLVLGDELRRNPASRWTAAKPGFPMNCGETRLPDAPLACSRESWARRTRTTAKPGLPVHPLAAPADSPWARYRNPPPPPSPPPPPGGRRGKFFGDNDFWIALYVSFQYRLVCKMNYSAFRDYLRWYIAA